MEKRISELIEENESLKLKVTDMEKKERQRGVYQIIADLNSANVNIKSLQKKLELKESEIEKLLKDKAEKINYIINDDLCKNAYINKIKINGGLENTEKNQNITEEANNIIKESVGGSNNIEREIQNVNEKKIEDLNLENNVLFKCSEEVKYFSGFMKGEDKYITGLADKINELTKANSILLREVEEKNNLISKLESENILIKSEIKDLKELKERKVRRLDSNLNSNFIENIEKTNIFSNNNNQAMDAITPDLSFINLNIQRNFPSDNLALADNLKDDLAFMQNQSFGKLDVLKRENESLALQLVKLKEDHKLELMRANLILEELVKIMNSNAACEEKEVNELIKNFKSIQNNIDNKTIEDLRKEKSGYLDTIAKLKMQLEANENATIIDIDNICSQYSFKKENCENYLTPRDFNKENLNQLTKENNQNQIRERERKIEYLLRILSEKNSIIEQLQNQNMEKILSPASPNESRVQHEFLQNQIDILLNELEEKNFKIKKQSKELNELTAKYEILQTDLIESQAKESEVKIHLEEIVMLKEKIKENEFQLEKLRKELKIQSTQLIRKEAENASLKAERTNSLQNRSLVDSSTQNLTANGSVLKDPKFECLSNSLNEIQNLNEKMKMNNLNKYLRPSKANSESINTSNNNSSFNHHFNKLFESVGNGNDIPRVIFEEDLKNKNDNYNEQGKCLIGLGGPSINDGDKHKSVDINNNYKFLLKNVSHSENFCNMNMDYYSNTSLKNMKNNNLLNDNYYNKNGIKDPLSSNDFNILKNGFDANNQEEIIGVGNNSSVLYNKNSNLTLYTNIPVNHNINNIDNNSNKNLKYFCQNTLHDIDINKQSIYKHPSSTDYSRNQHHSDLSEKFQISSLAPNQISVQYKIGPTDIIECEEHWSLLRNWISGKLKKQSNGFFFNKIFKAKEDGFSSNSFIKRVEGKSPTLIILKNNHEKILGGFTSIAWKTPKKTIDFLDDKSKTSFIFSLNLMKKFDLKDNSIAICHSICSGPIFGLNDLEIVENADKNYNNFSNIGTSYKFDGKLEEFYGDNKYSVEDYEVYEIIFP